MASLLYVILMVLAIATTLTANANRRFDAADQSSTKKSPLDLVVGDREPGDFLVHRDYFERPATDKRIIAFRSFDVANEYTITQVRALDQTNGTGGIVTYEYGGPGMTRVLLGFHSDVHQGIEYAIELYGKFYRG